MSKVIVYGTLKKGGRLHRYMRDSKFIVDVAVTGYKMYDSGFGYPFIAKGDKHKDSVWGEKYEVSDDTLKMLDMVEGVDSGLFKRVDLKDEKDWSDSRDSTYIYVGDEYLKSVSDAEEVKSGRWKVGEELFGTF